MAGCRARSFHPCGIARSRSTPVHNHDGLYRLCPRSNVYVGGRRGADLCAEALNGRKWVIDESKLLERITVNPQIYGGKPIIRGRRLAVEHVLAMLASGDTPETILKACPWLERQDIQACLLYARRVTANERIEPLSIELAEPGRVRIRQTMD